MLRIELSLLDIGSQNILLLYIRLNSFNISRNLNSFLSKQTYVHVDDENRVPEVPIPVQLYQSRTLFI